jgi:ATP-dependent exoDNAse (exonuclease V) alpha subunit
MTQKEALKILRTGRNVFLTGAAGTGKTHVLNSYIAYLKEHKVPVAITASTGIAATHMDGRTIHSWSGIALRRSLTQKDLDKLAYNTITRERINDARVLVIDEISMLDAELFSLIDRVCRFVRGKPEPFGNLQLVVCGDFFQLPPVGRPGEPVPEYAFHAEAWERADLWVCYLEKQWRQEDEEFLGVLNAIRNSGVDEETRRTLETRINREIAGLAAATKLFSHKNDVDSINDRELRKLSGEPHFYRMSGNGDAELIDSLKLACLAPETLELKKGALVMFVRNNHAEGYINGTLGTVVGFESDEPHYPIVQTKDGERITAAAVRWNVEDEEGRVLASISQVPLRLAWAITIHKSQGMTLDAAEINLSRAFGHGMGYVALSRVRSLEGIKLLGVNETALTVSPEITRFDAILRECSRETKKLVLEDDPALHQALEDDFLMRSEKK